MSAYAGAEPHAVFSRTVWLLVAAPLVGILAHLASALRARRRSREAPRGDAIGMASLGVCAGSMAVHVAALARESRGAFFLDALTNGAHVARFDAPIVLSLDAWAAAAGALACLVALIAALALSTSIDEPRAGRRWQKWVWLELSLAGALLAFSADDPVTMACGWLFAATAGAWLAGWTDSAASVRSGTRSAVGLVAFLFGAGLLLWGLRGTWHGDDFLAGPEVTGRLQFAEGILASPAALEAVRGRASPWGPPLVPCMLTLWILGGWAISAAPLRTPAPAPLAACAYGATTAWIGPFLLLRASALFAMAPSARALVACVGGAMIVAASAQALGRKKARAAGAWSPLFATAPGALAWLAIGASGGPAALPPASRAIAGGGLVTASLVLFALWPGNAWVPAASDAVAARSPASAALERIAVRLGHLLLSYERWVIEASGRGLLVLVAVASWAAMRTERAVFDPIGNGATARARRAFRRLFGTGAALALLVVPLHRASAAPVGWASPGGRIAVSLPNGDAGPLVLTPGSAGALEGAFVVRNAGTEPLTISRLALRGDEEDVRSPARVSVRFADGAASQATLPAGTSKTAVVTWIPDRDGHVRQAFGHVVVTSTDEASGEVAMGFRAELPTGLGWIGAHALSFLVLWPFLSSLLFVLTSRSVAVRARRARRFAFASGAVELAMALWAFRRFAPDIGRAAGNDGLQLVERFVWVRAMGAEWYVGVDGSNIALVLLAAAVALVAVGVRGSDTGAGERTLAAGLLLTGVMGVIVALDLALLGAAFCLVWLALAILVGTGGGPRAASAASKLTIYGLVGSASLLLAFVALSCASSAALLVDGTRVAHSLAIPELSRMSFTVDGTIFDLSFAHAAWVLLIVAVAMTTPIVPLHGWLSDVLEAAPPATAVMVAGAVLPLGPYLLVRVGLGAVPDGARWAGASLAALSAFGALWASLCALVQTDLRRFAAYAAVAGGAMSLYGIASLTPEGIAGGGLLVFAHGLSSALLLGVAAAVAGRIGVAAAGRVAGLGREAPFLAGLAALALSASAAAPGLVSGWGVLLAMLGAFVRYPALAFVVAAALVVSAAAHLRFARTMILGTPIRAAPEAEAVALFDGRLPDATFAELAVLLPLALLALGLGLWPAPILSSIATAAHDVSAAVDPAGLDVTVAPR